MLRSVHLSRSLSDSSTVSVVVGVGPRTGSSSVSSHNSNLDDGIESKVVDSGYIDNTSSGVGDFLALVPEDVHLDLAVDAVELRIILEVSLVVALFGGFPFSFEVLEFDGVTLNARSVVSSLLERDLQTTLFRLNGGLYWRNLRGNSSSLDLERRVGESTPSPSVAASNLVVDVLRSTEVLLLVNRGLRVSERVEVINLSNEIDPLSSGGEVVDGVGTGDVLDVVALNDGTSIKELTDREPLDADSTLLIVSAGLRVLHRLGNLLNSSRGRRSVLAGELSPSLSVSGSNLSSDQLTLILSVFSIPEGAHGKSAAFLFNDDLTSTVTESLVLLEDAVVASLDSYFVRGNFSFFSSVRHLPADADFVFGNESVNS